MPKSDNAPEKVVDPVPEKNKEAARIKKEWDVKHAGKGKQGITVPGTDIAIEFTRLEVEDNKVSIWLSEDTTLEPDYVIVNPPTAVYVSKDEIIDNPIGAIAYVINGAIK